MILLFAKREFASLIRSPSSWVLLAIMQLLFAWLFLSTLEDYLAVEAELSARDNAPGITAFMTFRYLAPASTLLLVLGPLLTMRAFSDEFRLNTWPLLSSAPIASHALIIGKFLGVFLFLSLFVLLSALMPFSLLALTPIDISQLLLAVAGLLLLGGLAIACTLLYSTMTSNNMVVAVASIVSLLILWVIGKGLFSHQWVSESLSAFAISTHLGAVFQGVLDTREPVYFIVLTAAFLYMAGLKLSARRLAGAY